MKHLTMLDRMNFYTVGDVGRSRHITPEGFMLCDGVAIARTGVQIYSPEEVALEPDSSGEIRVMRPEEEVFSERTIASFEGKSVTISHPSGFVNPDNWRDLTVGVVQNVRRGSGLDADLLIADLLITDANAIKYVDEAKPNLSAGYESDYEQTKPGEGIQRNIIANHVALVDRGRAGPRVAIRDQERTTMSKPSILDRIKGLAGLTDEKAAKAALRAITKDEEGEEEEGEGKKSMDARLRDAEKFMQECRDRFKAQDEAEEEEKKKKKEAEDAQLTAENAEHVNTGKLYTGDAYAEIKSRAEILAPGIQVPTADAIKTVGTLRTLMQKAITTAGEKYEAVKALIAGRDPAKLTGDALLNVFHGASEMVRIANNGRDLRPSNGSAATHYATRDAAVRSQLEDIQKANTDFWNKRLHGNP